MTDLTLEHCRVGRHALPSRCFYLNSAEAFAATLPGTVLLPSTGWSLRTVDDPLLNGAPLQRVIGGRGDSVCFTFVTFRTNA